MTTENRETWRLRQLALVISNIAALIVWYLVRSGISWRFRRANYCNHWECTIRRRAWLIGLALDWHSTESGWLDCLAWWQCGCWWKLYHTCYCTVRQRLCNTRSSIPLGRYSICRVDFPSHRYLDLKRRWIEGEENQCWFNFRVKDDEDVWTTK